MMKAIKRVVVSAMVALLVCGLSIMAMAHGTCDPGDRPEAGTVLTLQGKVTVIRPGGSQYEAKVGTLIRPEETVQTADNSMVQIVLEDGTEVHGTVVKLEANSKAQFLSEIRADHDPVSNTYSWYLPNNAQVVLEQGKVNVRTINGAKFEINTENIRAGAPEYLSTWQFEAEFDVEVTKSETPIATDPLANPATQQLLAAMLMSYGVTSIDQLTPEQRQEVMMLVQMTALYAEPMPTDVTTKVKVSRGKVALKKNFDSGKWDDTIVVYKGEFSEAVGIDRPTDPIPF